MGKDRGENIVFFVNWYPIFTYFPIPLSFVGMGAGTRHPYPPFQPRYGLRKGVNGAVEGIDEGRWVRKGVKFSCPLSISIPLFTHFPILPSLIGMGAGT